MERDNRPVCMTEEKENEGTVNRKNVPSPYNTAGVFSKITFWWVSSLFKTALKRSLCDADVYAPPASIKAGECVSKFESKWIESSQEKLERKGSLFLQLLQHFKGSVVFALVLEVLVVTIQIIQPLLTAAMVVRLGEGHEGRDSISYVYWIMLMISLPISALLQNHMFSIYDGVAMGMRTTCSAMIYKKVLKMSPRAHRLMNTGHIITLVSTDIEVFYPAMQILHALIFGPIWLVIFSVEQGRQIGIPAIIGAVLIILFNCLQYWNGKSIGTLRSKQELLTSKRVHLMSEIVTAMRAIKMYCWEKPFATKAKELRKTEMDINKKRLMRTALGFGLSYSFGNIFSYLMIMLSFVLGKPIHPQTTLTIFGGIKAMQTMVLFAMPYGFVMIYEVFAAMDHIKDFLLCEELQENTFQEIDDSSKAKVALSNIWAMWDTDGQTFERMESHTLKNINLTADGSALIGVTGKVGSGKTSLLMSIVGELQLLKGSCSVVGTVAYVPQESWVVSETVRRNIIMDQKFIEERYKEILKACCLDVDMEQLPKGDLTLVGERGLSLSGGQKARINLARAVYQDADIYLLDDPFAAVDERVGRKMFNGCVCGLLKNKLRILITHHTQYLTQVDKLLLMAEGEISMSADDKGVPEVLQYYGNMANEHDLMQKQNNAYQNMMDEGVARDSDLDDHLDTTETLGVKHDKETDRKLQQMTLAENEDTKVSNDVYWKYLKAGRGDLLLYLVIFLAVIVRVSEVSSDWLLVRWQTNADNTSMIYTNISMSGPLDDRSYVLVIGILVFVMAVFTFVSTILYALGNVMCSQELYNKMFDVVMRVPIYFFDTNPVGQTLNRFSRDTSFMDMALLFPALILSQSLERAIAFLIYGCIISPYMAVGIVIFMALTILIYKYTLPCIRAMRKIEAKRRSPTYSHLSATLQGLPVVRAFRKQQYFLLDAYCYIDDHTAAWYLFLSTQRFQVIFVSLAASVLGMVYATVIFFTKTSETGDAGLSIMYIIYLLIIWPQILQMMAEITIIMTSVERVQEFSTIEQEAPEHTEIIPDSYWPKDGHIMMNGFSVKYRGHSIPALGPINAEIKPSEKVGVVGRTGAGKSSLFAGLLRMVEPSGTLQIDGMEVTQIGLTDLRNRISVIPQDPLLFSGTLRFNIDPFGEFSDDRLWTALKQVQLSSKVEGLNGGLSTEMGEAGGNFSVGERQLLCLARALLRRHKVIIIDEATANVDNRTDAIIQSMISTEFTDATVLTIAHRLNTIIGYDRIMMLDKGQLVEFGHPYELLEDSSGMFYQMVMKLGPELHACLQEMAYMAYNRKSHPQPSTISQDRTSPNSRRDSKEEATEISEGGYQNVAYEYEEM